MATNDQKTPFGLSLNRFTQAKSQNALALQGRNIPCTVTAISGSIVTVAFQVTAPAGQTAITLPPATMPVASSEYVRLPIQVGCRGFAVSADYYMGGMSGLGGGTATTTQPANLGALVFVPVGNTAFSAVSGSALVLYGPQGVTLRDANSGSVVTLTATNITITTSGSVTLNCNVTINGNLQVNGNINATGTISP